MRSFDQFLAVLAEIPDPRRAEGKLYKLPYVLLFSILTVVTGGNSVSICGAPPTRDPSDTLRCRLRRTLRCVDGWGGRDHHGREHRLGTERLCGRPSAVIFSPRSARGSLKFSMPAAVKAGRHRRCRHRGLWKQPSSGSIPPLPPPPPFPIPPTTLQARRRMIGNASQ